ncbi:AEC family transporter [Microbacterium gorillae]|uniref:AEC family transporter n=1 Tax=Microbacterium gorillae TaxID=1231063 RepID=UPI00058D1D12|nr:AEC family transporter [Microbacterium gorillae]
MIGALTGFAVVIVAIVVGYVVARIDILGPAARQVLARLVFSVLSPCLLFTILSTADVTTLFSTLLPVSALAAGTMFVVFALVARLVWRRRLGESVIGSLASGYVNAGNVGIPLATYLLGDGAYAAPVTLVQLLVFMPVALVLLDADGTGDRSIGRVIVSTLRNPLLIGSVLGVAVAAFRIPLPTIITEPIASIGRAAVPIMLIGYGMSLVGQRVLTMRGRRRDVILASALSTLAMPLVAWAAGAFLFHLDPQQLYVVTVLAALPTAQNVFNYAQRYRVGEIIARDTIFLTTLASLPVLLAVTLLLAPR